MGSTPIALYGQSTLSGTDQYFREIDLYSGDYKPSVNREPGSEAVAQIVGCDKLGMGYSDIGYEALT